MLLGGEVVRCSGGLQSLAESELGGGAKQGLTLVGEVRHQAVPRTRGQMTNQTAAFSIVPHYCYPSGPPPPLANFSLQFALPAHHQSTASPTSAIWLQARWPPSTPYQRPRPTLSSDFS